MLFINYLIKIHNHYNGRMIRMIALLKMKGRRIRWNKLPYSKKLKNFFFHIEGNNQQKKMRFIYLHLILSVEVSEFWKISDEIYFETCRLHSPLLKKLKTKYS